MLLLYLTLIVLEGASYCSKWFYLNISFEGGLTFQVEKVLGLGLYWLS